VIEIFASMDAVARKLLGDPNADLSSKTVLRFGTHGSVAVDLKAGTFYDHENKRGGGVLDLICQRAGVPTHAAAAEWAKEQGLIEDDRPKKTIVKSYDYVDEAGQLLFQVVRYEPKQFKQRRPDGAGGWVWSVKGVRLVPYRLPELIEDIANGRTIFVVEGEKDVDTLRSHGIATTCNPMGNKKWWPSFNEILRGADVVLCGDNDQAGREHVALVAKNLNGVAARLRELKLTAVWPEAPVKGDISDWFAAGGTVEKLDAAVKALETWQETNSHDAAPPWGKTTDERRDGDLGSEARCDDDAEVDRLAKLPAFEYDRAREAAAEKLGVRVSTLDERVRAAREKLAPGNGKQGRELSLPEPEPWPEAVDGAELLTEISAAIRRYVVMTQHAADVSALWVVHTYAADAFAITPRLAIESPVKGCGKTTLLDCVACLVWRPLRSENTTVAAVFRTIEKARPTLLLDEVERFVTYDNSELLGILNSGHRKGGSILRVVGDDNEPRQFSTFGPCAFALIGRLPDTLQDRSIVIELKRRTADEVIELFRLERADHLHLLSRKARRWAADNIESLQQADPDVGKLFNRVADNWRALLAIADAAGGEWPQRARAAAAAIERRASEASIGIELLADIKATFNERAAEQLSSAEIVAALVAMEGRPWVEWGKQRKPMTQHALARQLREFKTSDGAPIAPVQIWEGGKERGYKLTQFDDAFRRYLAEHPPAQVVGWYESHEATESTDLFAANPTGRPDPLLPVGKCEKPNNDAHSTDLPLAKAGMGANGGTEPLCDHCGRPGALGQVMLADYPVIVWLHRECEQLWLEGQQDAETGHDSGIPFMITNAMRGGLHQRGYSDADIREMTPQQAHDILNGSGSSRETGQGDDDKDPRAATEAPP
jgi:putative DNA primase/helicase